MLTLVTIFHVLFALALILIVLIQDPKDGAMGVFGGGTSSNSFFGSTGAANFFTKTTRWLAVLFASCCMLLAYLNTHPATQSVMDNAPQAATPPAATDTHSLAPSAPPVSAPGTAQDSDGKAPATTTPKGQ